MHLRVILPLITDTLLPQVREEAESWILPTTELSVVGLTRGPASIESEYDEALAGPGILEAVAQAADDGVDGVFISCFGDPGVPSSREISDVPVVGGYEPAVLTALSLGDRVGVVTVLPNVVPTLRALSRRYGVAERIGAVRYVNLPVLGLEDHDVLLDRLEEQAADILAKDEADVIVLGCTMMLGVAQALSDRLAARGTPVPVVDPTGAGITWLESAHRMRLFPSRTTYMAPTVKERVL